MNGITVAIVAALCIGIVTLIVAMISRFLGRFNEETRRIADEMRRAQDSDEYIYWQSRLHRHYIRLLPFVSEKTAGRIYSRLFRKPKHSAEKKEHSDGLFHILAPSVLSVCLCAVCLCGMSWAWFTASTSTAVTVIRSASYAVTVTATNSDGTTTDNVTVDTTSGISTVTFSAAGTYTVTLTPIGDAAIGYCDICFSDKSTDSVGEYCTGNFVEGEIKLTVYATVNNFLTVTPIWKETTEESTLPKTLGEAPTAEEETDGVLNGEDAISETNEAGSVNSVAATIARTTTAATAKEEAETTSNNNSSQATETDATQPVKTEEKTDTAGKAPAETPQAGETTENSTDGTSTDGNAGGSGSQTGGAETAGNTTGGAETTDTDWEIGKTKTSTPASDIGGASEYSSAALATEASTYSGTAE